jgi:hypothetical protein
MEILFAALGERIDTETGISKSLLLELLLSRELRDEEAERFAQVSILYGELQGLVEDGMDEALAAKLARAEASQYVDDSGLVGVKPTDLYVSDDDVTLQRATIPKLEERLQEKARRLAVLAGLSSVDRVGAEVAGFARLVAERAEVEMLRLSVQLEEVSVLEKLDGVVNRTQERVELTRLHAEWMLVQSEGMLCKMLLLEKRMLKDTYSSRDVMAALSKLQAAVRAAREGVEARKRGLILRKKQFDDAGDQMKRLADEYAAVLKAIEETQWSLKELK